MASVEVLLGRLRQLAVPLSLVASYHDVSRAELRGCPSIHVAVQRGLMTAAASELRVLARRQLCCLLTYMSKAGKLP